MNVEIDVPTDYTITYIHKDGKAMRAAAKAELHENRTRRVTSKCCKDLTDFQLLVGNPPGMMVPKALDPNDGCWLFITIAFDPKMTVVSRSQKKRYDSCTYLEQLEACLRYYESCYHNYLRGISYGSWELDKSGKLHVHILFHSEDKIPGTYVLHTIRQGVKSDRKTLAFTKGRQDYCNNIVECADPSLTLAYITKDDSAKIGKGLPTEKYFYHRII